MNTKNTRLTKPPRAANPAAPRKPGDLLNPTAARNYRTMPADEITVRRIEDLETVLTVGVETLARLRAEVLAGEESPQWAAEIVADVVLNILEVAR